MDVLGIDNVFFEVGNLDVAVRLYRDILGLPVASGSTRWARSCSRSVTRRRDSVSR
jgi:catechol 2,3-dioxygenase-like lactoylglutathione lyase family enzyme